MPFGTEAYGTATYGEGEFDLEFTALVVEAQFEAGVWTGLDGVRSLSTKRGRDSEFDSFSAGTAAAVVDNRDRSLDPTYEDGPYFPNVKPNRPFRVGFVWGGTTYYLFTGLINGFPQEYRNPSDGFVQLTATDAFKVFARAENPTPVLELDDEDNGFLDQAILASAADLLPSLTGAQIQATLDSIDWTDYDLDAGRTTVPAGQSHGPVLGFLQDLAATEDGRFFISGDGTAIFRDRHSPYLDPTSSESQAIFGDGPGELPYSDITFDYSDSQIRNHVIIRMPGRTGEGGQVSVEDADAIEANNGIRQSYQRDVLYTDPTLAQNHAEFILGRYKDPFLRIDSITINAFRDPAALLPQVLSREIGDRITIKRRPQGIGDPIVQEALIEGVSHFLSPNSTMTTTWNLSPADTANYLILDDPVRGLLDDALLGY